MIEKEGEHTYEPCSKGLISISHMFGLRKSNIEEKINVELYRILKKHSFQIEREKKMGFYFNTLQLCQRVIRGLFLLPRNKLSLKVQDISLAELLIRIMQINLLWFWNKQTTISQIADQLVRTIKKTKKICHELIFLNGQIKFEEVELISQKMKPNLSDIIKHLEKYIQIKQYHDPNENPYLLKFKYVLLNVLRKSKENIVGHINNRLGQNNLPDLFKREQQQIYIMISYLYLITKQEQLDSFLKNTNKSLISDETQQLLIEAFQSIDGMPMILNYIQDAPFSTLQSDKRFIEYLFES